MNNHAASPWIKYNPDSLFAPAIGEWLLWSMVIGGARNYFSGSLYEINGNLWLQWQGGLSYRPDETLYWARVKPVQLGLEG